VGIDDLIADFVQALLLFPGPKKAASRLRNPTIVPKARLKRQFSRVLMPDCGLFIHRPR
jgi:hypothetical protein